MKSFDIFLDESGAVSACRANSRHLSQKLATIKAISKNSAVTMAKARIKSGVIKMPVIQEKAEPKKENMFNWIDGDVETKKAIFCDFNGVLNDSNKLSNEMRVEFKLSQESCPHKLMRVIKLALKHDAELVMTSLWRIEGITYSDFLGRCLLNCDIPEYVEFYKENRREIKRLTHVAPTGRGDSRDAEIAESILFNEYTHFVVLEDEHKIREDFNVVMTDSFTGLTDEHIERADAFLSEESLTKLQTAA